MEDIPEAVLRAMIDDNFVMAHRMRSLSPDHPTLRGTAQNPDVFFQSRETVNKYYEVTPGIVQKYMDKFAELTGRSYHLFDYVGAPDAERVIVSMASSCDTAHETVECLVSKGEKVGVLKVRLYRPFDAKAFVNALPKTVKKIAVLDRTKEPGSTGEPLYMDIRTAVGEMMETGQAHFNQYPVIVGGRYGLGSKDFNPPQVKAVLDNLKADKPKNHFTVGIVDDLNGTSLDVDYSFHTGDDGYAAMFYGLGSDGTVGANKNTIKIIGEATDNYAQGYFVYDSKKAGAMTVSHVRFGPKLLRKPYLIDRARFVACHNFSFLEKYDMLDNIVEGGIFLLNSPYGPEGTWDMIPAEVQKQIIDKNLKFYVIDGVDLGMKLGLGSRINMIMQTAFFQISEILPEEEAIQLIKDSIKKTYGKKGEKIVQMNYNAVDEARKNVFKVEYPKTVTSKITMPEVVPADAPDFIKNVTAVLMSQKGDQLPVSVMPHDGTFPTGTTKYEKRNIAVQIPEWDPAVCIQCGQCSLVCPHATIRIKDYDGAVLSGAPATFKSADAIGPKFKGMKFTVQIAPEDCTGCGLCVATCPARAKDADGNKTERHAINMVSQFEIRKQEAENYDFFLTIPNTDESLFNRNTVKGSQLLPPLFEYSGACAGCGETPYVKLMSQLFGDRAVIANATGCSSIYGGNLPTTPYTKRDDGRGPAWSNSLFEDNAEFGLGFRLTIDKFNEFAKELLATVVSEGAIEQSMADKILAQDQSTQDGIEAQRANVAELKAKLQAIGSKLSGNGAQLLSLGDYLVKKDVWVLGGDGWAYDIGYGGLDHVLASGKNVNVLVLDTEVYSNTGGQMSKSTPRGATAKFAASGKPMGKKDLGMMAMSYGNVYVAKVSMGANMNQVVKAFAEAAAYDGPSLIIAYAHCIAHGFNLVDGLDHQKLAVNSGHWVLYRYNPELTAQGKNPLSLDSKEPTVALEDYIYSENRYKVLQKSKPEHAQQLLLLAQGDVKRQQEIYRQMAEMEFNGGEAK